MKTEDFWSYFDIAPLCLLAECMYHNECKHGISWGDECCDFLDADPLEEASSCDTCEKSEEKYLYYPSITDEVLLNLILICGTEGLDLPLYYSEEHRDKILNFAIIKSKDEDIRTRIREYLIGVEQKYGRM